MDIDWSERPCFPERDLDLDCEVLSFLFLSSERPCFPERDLDTTRAEQPSNKPHVGTAVLP